MHKSFIIFFISWLISIISPFTAASENPLFNYSQSVALILKVENGGHIFQRPDEDEPRNVFRMSFSIIAKYLGEVQSEQTVHTLDMSSLIVEYNFILINHDDTKLFYMGDHWIGDEKSFAIMTSEDYFSLKDIFDSSKRHRNDVTPEGVLKGYTADIHNLWGEDREEYERLYHFPEKAAKLNDEMNLRSQADNDQNEKNHSFEETESHIPPATEKNSAEATTERSKKEEGINTQKTDAQITSTNHQTLLVADSVQNQKTQSRENDLSSSQVALETEENQGYLASLLLFALALFVIGYFWRRQR
jgi:hypothetical protein